MRLLSTKHFDGLDYKKNWLIMDIRIYYQQNISTKWDLAIGIDRPHSNKYNNKNSITLWQQSNAIPVWYFYAF